MGARNVLLVVMVCLVSPIMGLAQTNTIQLRNGSQTTTILPSNNTVRIQIPDIPEGETVYLNTSNVAPVTTTGGGGLLYGTSVMQNSLGLGPDNPYLFYVSYSSASDGTAFGGRIISTSIGTNYAATGLTLSATATGTGDAAGLVLSANSGTGREDALIISNGQLRMNSSNTKFVSFRVSPTLSENTQYVWPENDGSAGTFLTVDDNGNMRWATLGSVSSSTPTLALDDILSVMYDHDATKLSKTLIIGHELSAGELTTIMSGDGAINNVGIGYAAMDIIETGDDNTGVGNQSLSQLKTGSRNVVLGSGAGADLESGNNNIIIGYSAGPASGGASISDKLYIDNSKTNTPLIYGDFSSDAITINGTFTATGNTSIGSATTAGQAELRLYEPTSGGDYNAFKTIAQANSYTYSLPTDTPSSGEVLKVTSISGSDVVLEWGIGTPDVTLEAGTVNNTTLRWDNPNSKWVENTGVKSDGTNLTVTGGRVTSQTATFTNTTNQLTLGITNTTTISAVAPQASVTYSIPDAGTNASFVMTEGSQTIGGDKTFSGTTAINGGASAAELRFYEPSGNGANYTAFKATGQGANIIYTLPFSDGSSGAMLTTNGAGTLTWASAPSSLTIDNLSDAKSGGTNFLYSMILGHQTTGSLLGAEYNTAVGYDAMDAITQGDDNAFFGWGSGSAINISARNTGVGKSSQQNAYGWDNTTVGFETGYNLSSDALGNTGIGNRNFKGSSTGDYNVGIGYSALETGGSGSNNIAIGYQSLKSTSITGSKNIAIGDNVAASTGLTSGTQNVVIGHDAGTGITSGSRNVLIGYNVGTSLTTQNDKLYIDNSNTATPLVQGDFSSDALTVNGTLTTTSDATFNTTLKLKSSSGAGGITLQAGAMGATGYTYTMPTSAPSTTQALKVASFDGTTAVLEWGSISNVDLSAPGPIGGTTPSTATFTNATITGTTSIGTAAGQAELRLYEPLGDGVNYNAFKTIAQSNTYTYSLPTDTPATNEVLKVTSISGSDVVLEWGTGGADLSAPGVIGSTTPNSANFTTVNITNTTNQLVLGTAPNTTTITSVAPTSSITYSIPDVSTNASFVMTEGAQTVNGNKTFTGTTAINGGATAAELRFYEPLGSGTNYTAFKATAQGADIVYTLPFSDGSSGSILTTNGSGTLTWSSSPSALAIDNLSDAKSGGDQFTGSLILGHQTTGSLSAASNNTAVGIDAMKSLTSGTNNTAVGNSALKLVNSGLSNSAFGQGALQSLTSGSSNSAFGQNALYTAATSGNNTAIGYFTGYLVTSGQNNTFLGYAAGWGVSTGSGNIGIGWGFARNGEEAGHSAADVGSYNIAIGYSAMYNGPSLNDNIGIGYYALNAAFDAANNIAIGKNTGILITSGDNNTILGYNAGSTLTTGSSNVFIGYNVASAAASDASNLLYIDNSSTASPLIYGDFTADALTFNGTVTATGDVTLGSGTSTTGGSIIMHDNATLTSFTATILSANLAASRNYTIPDAGADGSFVMTAGSNLSGGYTTGDILYASAANTLQKLAIGTSGQVLTVSGGIPAWGSGMPTGTTTNSTLLYNGTSWVENANVLSTSDGTMTLKATSNQIVLGTGTATTTITSSPASSRTYTIPDVANASFVMTEGAQTINGTKTLGGVVIASPAAQVSTVTPVAVGSLGATASTGAIAVFTGLYNTVSIGTNGAGTYVKLPVGTANGQLAYLRLSFADGASASNTVTVRNSNDVNTATVYDGVGADVILMHLLWDTTPTPARWIVISSVLMP